MSMSRVIGELSRKCTGEKGIGMGIETRVRRRGTLKDIWDKRVGESFFPERILERIERLYALAYTVGEARF